MVGWAGRTLEDVIAQLRPGLARRPAQLDMGLSLAPDRPRRPAGRAGVTTGMPISGPGSWSINLIRCSPDTSTSRRSRPTAPGLDRIGVTPGFNAGNQIGRVPAVILDLDLDRRVATWSLDALGSETLGLDDSLVPERRVRSQTRRGGRLLRGRVANTPGSGSRAEPGLPRTLLCGWPVFPEHLVDHGQARCTRRIESLRSAR